MEISKLGADPPRWWNARLGRLGALGLFVGVVAQHEAQQQSRHHDIAQPEHREVATVVNTGKYQLSW